MVSNRSPAPVTLLFLAAFAVWLVADRYVDVAFYRLMVGEAAEVGLTALMTVAFAAVIGASLLRSWRGRAVEWPTLAISVALLLAAELAWRFVIEPLPMNGFKVAAVVMGVGTPVFVILGLCAAITEWRGLARGRDATTV